MTARLPRSLQARLLVLVLGLVTLVWIGTAARTWFDAQHELDELLDSHLAQAAAILVAQQVHEMDDDHGVDAPVLHRYASRVAFQVFHEGKLVLRSAGAPVEPMAAAQPQPRSGFATVQIAGNAWRVFATHGAERDVQVYVGEQASSRDSILWAVLRGALWPMLVALPLLGLAVGWAIDRGVAPLRRLGRALAQRQAQDLAPVRLDDAPSEMAPLVAALNGLFGRIGDVLEAERRFTADAAHELRTPIAAIRAQAQVALAETDDGLRRGALRKTLAGCDRAARLVDQLLTLARLEALAPATAGAVDLAAITRQAVAEIAPRAIAGQQSIALDAADGCWIDGDETLLAVLVRNLVDNAVRYSPPLARIELRVERHDGQVLLTVEDSGPGLSPPQLARLGERFFRVEGGEGSGSGLGWSIVQRIAAAHGATVSAKASDRLSGLAVHVAFGAAAPG